MMTQFNLKAQFRDENACKKVYVEYDNYCYVF